MYGKEVDLQWRFVDVGVVVVCVANIRINLRKNAEINCCFLPQGESKQDAKSCCIKKICRKILRKEIKLLTQGFELVKRVLYFIFEYRQWSLNN